MSSSVWSWDAQNRRWLCISERQADAVAEERVLELYRQAEAQGIGGAAFYAMPGRQRPTRSPEAARMRITPEPAPVEPAPLSDEDYAADGAAPAPATDPEQSTARPEPKRYSRIDRASLSDGQLTRLVDLVDLAEQAEGLRVHRYFGAKTQVERDAQTLHELDRAALAELLALLVAERAERVVDDHDGGRR